MGKEVFAPPTRRAAKIGKGWSWLELFLLAVLCSRLASFSHDHPGLALREILSLPWSTVATPFVSRGQGPFRFLINSRHQPVQSHLHTTHCTHACAFPLALTRYGAVLSFHVAVLDGYHSAHTHHRHHQAITHPNPAGYLLVHGMPWHRPTVCIPPCPFHSNFPFPSLLSLPVLPSSHTS